MGSASMPQAARLLLVHTPLVGSATRDLVAADLAAGGCEVGVPDLTGTITAGPPYCLRQAEVIARSASGQPSVLIGHSGAGPLLGWGGWGSNPRPADYEASRLHDAFIAAELRKG